MPTPPVCDAEKPSDFMNLNELQSILAAHPDKAIRIQLPDGRLMPDHYHVTEVGHVAKRFIDCGGAIHHTDTCVLQTWVATDEEHRLESSKLAAILRLSASILPGDDLPVEVEYEDGWISQFPLDEIGIEPDAIIFRLTSKHTDCLAKEQCGLGEESCCGESIGCC